MNLLRFLLALFGKIGYYIKNSFATKIRSARNDSLEAFKVFNERQLRIISLLQSQEKVSVSELTAEFGVSLVTVRQDLKKLEDQGVLKRTHGGAVAVDNGYDTSTRMWNNYEKKQRIVQRAAGLVSDGETIIIETGSTCSLLARELATKRGITVVSITHYMEEAAQADRVLVMSKGHVVMEGTPKEVFSQTEKVRALHLDVPQAAELRDELAKAGIPMPEGIIDTGACAQALYELLQ